MDTIIKYWKRFAGWATGSGDRVLRWAHLRLTLYYVLLLAAIIGMYSSFLYFSLEKNIRGNFSERTETSETAMFEEAVDSLGWNLVSIDLTALAIGSVFAYVLAKTTLKPVKRSFLVQQRFSADTSHELRTPLAIMKTDSEVVLRSGKNGDGELRLLAERNLEEIERMSGIVEGLLALSRGGNADKIRRGKINLAGIAEKLTEKMRKSAQNRNVTIILEKMEKGTVPGNRAAIEQAIMNLLQNAINYTLPGGKIAVAVRSGHRYMTFLIKDTGVGISRKDLPRIFERFYKADSAQSVESEGAGLGLAIVKETIDRHGGKINISSRLGKGTAVMVQLPKAVD